MRCLIETTVLADILLKRSSAQGKAAVKALEGFSDRLLPVYAIKEFKKGPLRYFAWAHNRLAEGRKFSTFMAALHRLSRTPQRYMTSTSLEAIRDASETALSVDADTFVEGAAASSADEIVAERLRFALKVRIELAWRRRRKIATQVIEPLSCYREHAPRLTDEGLYEVSPVRCNPPKECSLGDRLRPLKASIETLLATLSQLPQKPENAKRATALRVLTKGAKQRLTEDNCNHLGDAVFALVCPADATILSTNVRDLRPLADALGLEVKLPD